MGFSMRMALVVLLVFPALASAQPRGAAELFPPSTVAFAELRDPAKIADTLAALVKGTPFDDGLKLLHDRKDANKDSRLFHGSPGLSWATVLASPEMLAEVRKFRGAAVGFLGLTKDHEPKIAFCAQLGESTAAALLVKVYLANEATFRRVDTLDGIPVFQSRGAPSIGFDPNTGKPLPFEPKPATEGPCEPTFAYVPGLFIVASNKEAIADILARYRGKAKESLATQADFAPFAAGRQPGINGFVRLAEFVKVCDAAKKAKKDAIDASLLAYLKLGMNPKAVPVLTAHAAIRPDGFAITLDAHRDAAQPSALLDLFDGTLPAEAVRVCPANAAGAISIAFPAKPKRAAALVNLTDALAKAEGVVGKLPGEWLADAEKTSGLNLRERYLADIRAASLIFAPKQELARNLEPWPMLALHLEPGANAAEWEADLPKWFAAVEGSGKPIPPSSETILGVKVWTLPHAGAAVHYARADSTWVFGQDRKWVAACCAAAKGPALAAELTKHGAKLPEDSTTAFAAGLPNGLMQFTTVQRQFHRLGGTQSPQGFDFNMLLGGALLPPGILDPQPAGGGPFTAEELTKLFGPLPPFTASAARKADRLSLELRWDFGPAGAKGFVAKLIPILEKIGTGEPNPSGRNFLFDR